jgi:peptidoglycan/xylan/chitin deacetylase (PgdA/CDA1 family)
MTTGIIIGMEINQVVGEKATIHQCRCVLFRFDDIRNGYLESVQKALLNYFISHNQSVTLGLVMNQLDDKSELVNTIRNGYSRNLFELGIHGWDHVDYTNLTGFEQQSSLLKANQKINLLFSTYPRIFIPPFNLFNNDTLSSMQRAGMNILSSAIYYDEPDIISMYEQNPNSMNKKIFHIPEMTDFSIYYNGNWVKAPIKFILSDIDFDINTYGYSVVMIHPHNFGTPINGTLVDSLDLNQLNSLNSLINMIKSKNITSLTFSEAAGIE